MLTISLILTAELPNITFIDSSKLNDYSYINLINSINVINNNSFSSSFFYYNGEYHHFINSLEDKVSNKPITYKNIIIDASCQKNNILYVYTGGLFRSYIKGSNLFLSEGKTYWDTLDKNSSLNFTLSNLGDNIQNLDTNK